MTNGGRLTIAAIGITAFASCDLVHEVVGHGLAVLLVPGVRAISLSSVALPTTGESRVVAAAGSLANLIAGGIALALSRRRHRFWTGAYFLWLFGAVNLLNGSGYPLYSAILGSGDWEVVVRGLQPAIGWRAGLGLVGALAYISAISLAARELGRAVEGDRVSTTEIPWLVFLAYVVGSTLLVAASALNPIGPSLILLSGVSSGFAAMAGLTAVPALVEKRVGRREAGAGAVSFRPGWVLTGVVVAIVFTTVVGRGIAIAQTTESNPHDAQPERPSVATHAWTVAPGWIEIEAGTEFDRYDDHAHGETAPLVAKIGLTRRTQLELQTPIVHSRGLHAAAGDLLVGVKWRAPRPAPVVATLAVFPSIKFPTGSTASGAGTGTTDLGVVLISSRQFGSVSLDLNAGFTHRMGDDDLAPHDSSVWAMAFGGPAFGPLGWAAELFGYPPTSGPSGDNAVVGVLCGPTMKVRGWLVFDAGVIVPVEGPQARAIYAGAVYNIGHLGRAH